MARRESDEEMSPAVSAPLSAGGSRRIPVALEANIGAGKSTLLEYIRSNFGGDVTVLPEPTDKWCEPREDLAGESPLGLMYSDEKRNGAFFQFYALTTRMEDCFRAAESAPTDIVLYERNPMDEGTFLQMAIDGGTMGPFATLAYTSLVGLFKRNCGGLEPRRFIYLRTPPAVCLERIAMRNRREELGPDMGARLEALHELHEKLFGAMERSGVLVLDGNLPVSAHREDLANFFAEIKLGGLSRTSGTAARP